VDPATWESVQANLSILGTLYEETVSTRTQGVANIPSMNVELAKMDERRGCQKQAAKMMRGNRSGVPHMQLPPREDVGEAITEAQTEAGEGYSNKVPLPLGDKAMRYNADRETLLTQFGPASNILTGTQLCHIYKIPNEEGDDLDENILTTKEKDYLYVAGVPRAVQEYGQMCLQAGKVIKVLPVQQQPHGTDDPTMGHTNLHFTPLAVREQAWLAAYSQPNSVLSRANIMEPVIASFHKIIHYMMTLGKGKQTLGDKQEAPEVIIMDGFVHEDNISPAITSEEEDYGDWDM
jgi:hypothetical protein